MNRWRLRFNPFAFIENPVYRRKVLLYAVAGVITVIALAATTICLVILSVSSSSLADRLAEAGVVIAGFTLVLTVVAALVALLAYAVSTGLPELAIQIRFPFSETNKPNFRATVNEHKVLEAVNFKQLACAIRIHNDSNYSARNPAIIIHLHDMAFYPDDRMEKPGWTQLEFASTYGVTSIQWDGGSDYSIHGNSVRRLPDLWLSKLHTCPDPDPYFEIEVLADGYRKKIKVPVDFEVNEVSFFPGDRSKDIPQWL